MRKEEPNKRAPSFMDNFLSISQLIEQMKCPTILFSNVQDTLQHLKKR